MCSSTFTFLDHIDCPSLVVAMWLLVTLQTCRLKQKPASAAATMRKLDDRTVTTNSTNTSRGHSSSRSGVLLKLLLLFMKKEALKKQE